jgi:hypothetical protein
MTTLDTPTYDPKTIDLNTLIITQQHVVIELWKLSDEIDSPTFHDAVAAFVAAYGVVRKEARKLMVERIGNDAL